MTFYPAIDTKLSEGVRVLYDGTYTFEFDLGYIPDENEVIAMSVELHPAEDGRIGNPTTSYEFVFGIRRKDAEVLHRVSEMDFKIATVRKFVSKAERRKVLQLICECLVRLTNSSGCKEVSFATFYENPPERALEKYAIIGQALESQGFSLISRFQDSAGKHYWQYAKS